MSDQDRLEAMLRKIATTAQSPALDSDDPQDLLTGILRMINETVLARELAISFDGGGITLLVAKRRLFAVAGDLDFDLSDGEGVDLIAMGRDLVECIAASALTVTVTRPNVEPDVSDLGVSVDDLARAWAEASVDGPDIASVCAGAAAHLRWSGEQETDRNDPQGDLNGDIDRAALRDIGRGARGLVALPIWRDDTALVFIWDNDDEAVVVCARSELAALVRSWRPAVSG